MIYTVTFNPAIDYVIKVDNLTLGQVNRTTREYIFCGGKGINVSHLLANLGVDSVGLGFIAGFTGDVIESGAKELGFKPDFIRVREGMTRINVKVKSNEESEINGLGPVIHDDELEQMFNIGLDVPGAGIFSIFVLTADNIPLAMIVWFGAAVIGAIISAVLLVITRKQKLAKAK